MTPQRRQTILKARKILSHVIDEQFDSEVMFLQQLVRARSTNRYTAEESPADVPVEAEVAATICKQMRSFGWQPTLHGVSVQRLNVLYVRRGKAESKTLILNTHMDTAPTSDMYTRDPWGAQIENGRLYGIGAADAKAQIAAFIYAVHALDLAGLEFAGTLKLAFVVDEEKCNSLSNLFVVTL
jgi:acetylornithine deacetylase/succinyl-diaminopimelate desuccinylase-like protein